MSTTSQLEMNDEWMVSEVQQGKPNYVGNADLERYQVNIDISSVAYVLRKDKPEVSMCVVLLQVDFVLRSTLLANARIPFGIHTAQASRSVSTIPQFDLPFWYPNREEVIETGEVTFRKSSKMMPQFTAPTPVGTVGVSGVGHASETTGTKKAYIKLRGIRKAQSENAPPQVKWICQNNDSDYYPECFKLLLTVSSVQADASGFFPFSLTIEEQLKVRGHGESGFIGQVRSAFRPEKPPPGGWVFQIKGNYNTEEAFKTYRNVATNPPTKCIGLTPAAADYWEKQRQTSADVLMG